MLHGVEEGHMVQDSDVYMVGPGGWLHGTATQCKVVQPCEWPKGPKMLAARASFPSQPPFLERRVTSTVEAVLLRTEVFLVQHGEEKWWQVLRSTSFMHSALLQLNSESSSSNSMLLPLSRIWVQSINAVLHVNYYENRAGPCTALKTLMFTTCHHICSGLCIEKAFTSLLAGTANTVQVTLLHGNSYFL